MARYSSGWRSGSKNSRQTTRSCIESQNFLQIQNECLTKGVLWEDPMFPANRKSLNIEDDDTFAWKRPGELCEDPHMTVDGFSRSDVLQGELGNCWFLAAICGMCRTGGEELMRRVIPEDNTFQCGRYAGVFHFMIWHHGDWLDVVIDDRLPIHDRSGRLQFTHSPKKNEFWSALLEKAYAKLQGSYGHLKAGTGAEAMIDFTGGICEVYNFTKGVPRNLFKTIQKLYDKKSIICAYVDTGTLAQYTVLDNGLITGHAYTVTNVKTLNVRGKELQLLRVRNPWGDSAEWNGAWGDRSKAWDIFSEEERRSIGLQFADDGEFWISYHDFAANFDEIEICLLNPGAISDKAGVRWEVTQEEGSWTKGVNAGGCKNYKSSFWMNPQYKIFLHDTDIDHPSTGSITIGLMQNDVRRSGKELLIIGYAIYKLPKGRDQILDQEFFLYNKHIAVSRFKKTRGISGRHCLEPGDYVIIPSTFNPDEEANFFLRIFSEIKVTSREMDAPTGRIAPDPLVEVETRRQAANVDDSKKIKSVFNHVAGPDREVDAYQLRKIINSYFKPEVLTREFSLECCRSMVAMMDIDKNGKLWYPEFKKLWKELHTWKATFKQFDKDKSGTFDSNELRQALNFAGISIANATFSALVMRYQDPAGKIYLPDFIHCAVKITTMFDIYKQMDGTLKQPAELTLDQFVQTTMYA